MYRKLVFTLAFVLVSGALLWATWGMGALHTGHLQAMIAAVQSWGLLRFRSNLGLVTVGLIQHLLGFGGVFVLVWAGAFHPLRRPSTAVAITRYTALSTVVVYALFALHDTMRAIGAHAALYSQQTNQGLLLTVIGALPHRLVEIGALALILSAPIYILIRSLQVMSVRQASFEGWLELRHHWRWMIGLLLAAALTEVYITPSVTAALLR